MKSIENPKGKIKEKVVRLAGLEPARVTPLPPQSSVSANSTISAWHATNEAVLSENRKGIFTGLEILIRSVFLAENEC